MTQKYLENTNYKTIIITLQLFVPLVLSPPNILLPNTGALLKVDVLPKAGGLPNPLAGVVPKLGDEPKAEGF